MSAPYPHGLFITFEGIDGSGKSTHARLLAEHLAARGAAVCHTVEPGGTPFGRELRRLLLEPGSVHPTAHAELLLYLADRAQHLAEVIEPALAAGRVVVCERYHDSTIAYQAFGRGLPRARVRRLCDLVGRWPDVTVLLDLDPAAALDRLGPGLDRLEAEGVSLLSKVAAGYRRLAAREPGRFIVVTAARPLEQVAAALRAGLASHPALQAALKGGWL